MYKTSGTPGRYMIVKTSKSLLNNISSELTHILKCFVKDIAAALPICIDTLVMKMFVKINSCHSLYIYKNRIAVKLIKV